MNVVEGSLVPLELYALQRLVCLWAKPEAVTRRRGEWKAKIPAFRKAVIAGKKRGRRETVAHEIVTQQYQLIQSVVRTMRKEQGSIRTTLSWPRAKLVEYVAAPPGGPARFPRLPAPIPQSLFGFATEAYDRRGTPSEIARSLVAKRLRISGQTVKNAMRRRQRVHPAFEHNVLASLFLDCASFRQEGSRLESLSLILRTLLESGYPALMAYYLVQAAHGLPERIAARPLSYEEVQAACEVVRGARLRGNE